MTGRPGAAHPAGQTDTRPLSRAEKVAEAQRLRADGLLVREIAERMGATRSAVDSWLNDPDLCKQRARRLSYRGVCVDCGAATDGSNGRAKAPTRCEECSRAYQASRRADSR